MKTFSRIAAAAVGAATAGVVLLVAVVAVDDSDASATEASGALIGVPAEYRPWISKADAACAEPEMTPALLASQLHQESRFDAAAVSPAGAEGPAQFMPATWPTWGRDDDLNARTSPRDIGDAVMAQGRFMCSLLGPVSWIRP